MVFGEELATFISNRSFNSLVLPDYNSLNVRNISSITGEVFSIQQLEPIQLPRDYVDDFHGVEKILFIILDGLGYTRLLSYIERSNGLFKKIAEKGVFKFLSTTFPSTTSTALANIFTGLPPAVHGIVGFLMFQWTYGLIFNTLTMAPIYPTTLDLDIVKEFSTKIIPYTHVLREQAIEAITITRRQILSSGLSRALPESINSPIPFTI